MAPFVAYALRTELRGHEDDVRSILSGESGGVVVTSSYDGTVRLWKQESDQVSYGEARILTGHKGFVAALSWVDGHLASGGNDATVRLWGECESEPRKSLTGHRLQVWFTWQLFPE